MPVQVSYPGVYLEEIPGGQPVVAGVSTASTAFVDFFSRGPMNDPQRVISMQDVERAFGGLDRRSEASYGLRQYFLNGGQEAWVVRTGDGTARKAERKVVIKTPGLPARVKISLEEFQAAEKAAKEAQGAAEAASEALAKLQDKEITDQEREQGKEDLRGETRRAAEFTRQATAATRRAAVQARAASDELALAIAKVAAASGPVADRTAMAADKSAQAAQAAADAAQATHDITKAAQSAADVAEEALRTSQGARTAAAAADHVQAVLDAAEAAAAAHAAAKAEQDKIAAAREALGEGESLDVTPVKQAAVAAAAQAGEAAARAEEAAEAALRAARAVYDRLKAQEAEGADAAKTAVDNAESVLATAREKVRAASSAEWDADTAGDADGAEAALGGAVTVAAEASAAAGGDPDNAADPNAQAIAAEVLANVLAIGKEAATAAAGLAGKAESPDDRKADAVVSAAIAAIDGAAQASRDAVKAAKGGAEDAKVAADSVTSGEPALLAKAAAGLAGKAETDTRSTLEQARAVKLQINQAISQALASAPGAEAAAGKEEPEELAAKVELAQEVAQKAGNAADNALAAAEAVEKAAVTTSQVSVQASRSSDAAAQAAEAAVVANQEAAQDPTLVIEAVNEGVWGNNLEVTLEVQGTLFSLSVREVVIDRGVPRQLAAESYHQLTLDPESSDGKKALPVVNHGSNLVQLRQFGPKIAGAYPDEVKGKFLENGDDGGLANADQLVEAMKTLDGIEPALFNILCLPAVANYDDSEAGVAITEAHVYCGKKRAFFIADIPPKVKTVEAMQDWAADYANAKAYSMAVYFPRLILPDPLDDYRPRNVGASGTVAGVYSRTDTNRGVWKAPAGVEAVIQGAEVAVRLTDDQNGQLNPRGINVLRAFPVYGNIVWGARTLAGADQLSSEYKYVNVRRLMNYVEESIFRSIKWAVFEPNNETLWGKIRLQINGFLNGLFADGAFQGTTPATAYFVRCDGTTTTPLDIEMGVVNVEVGIAPVKPAEFIILKFQQIAGQAA